MSPEKPRVLVIRLSSLGDVVLTLPVYKNLKAHWPGCRICVLTKPAYAPLFKGNPWVDEVIAFRGLRSAVRAIRAGGFTHLLDLHGNLRSLILRRLSRVPETVRYKKDALARRLFVALGRPSPALAKHTIDRYLESLRSWGVPTPIGDIRFGDYGAETYPQTLRAESSARKPSSQRVLVIQTAFLGDATLTLPLRGIKERIPGCRLTVLCRATTADIFRSSPWTDDVLVDYKRSDSGTGGFVSLARRLKAEKFDLAIVPHRSLRSAALARLAGIPDRIGFSSSAGRLFFTQTIPFTWGMHDLERNLGLLLPFFQPASPAVETLENPVYLTRRGSGAESVRRRLAEAGIAPDAVLAGIHPGSVWPTKRWPAERYSALIRRLELEAGVRSVLVGGGGDRELSAGIVSDSGTRALDWTGRTSLEELIELMPRLSIFITNDSGPMHVAAASGVPTLAIFGPTTRELGFFPYGGAHRVLETDLACRPCGLHGSRACPEGHFLCMRLIGVDRVFQAARDMLAARREPVHA